jgi:hypothetical protein
MINIEGRVLKTKPIQLPFASISIAVMLPGDDASNQQALFS